MASCQGTLASMHEHGGPGEALLFVFFVFVENPGNRKSWASIQAVVNSVR